MVVGACPWGLSRVSAPQDFVEGQLLITAEHEACADHQTFACHRALSLSARRTSARLRGTGDMREPSPCPDRALGTGWRDLMSPGWWVLIWWLCLMSLCSPGTGEVTVDGREVALPFSGAELSVRRASSSFLLLQTLGAHVLWGLETPNIYITLQPTFAGKVWPVPAVGIWC